MAGHTVLLDASVLYAAPVRDLLLELALSALFQAKWTERINEEWIRHLLANRPDLTAANRTSSIATTRCMKEHRMRHRSRSCVSSLLWVVVLGLVATAVAKAPPPSGTLSIATTSIAVGIGVHWGNGTLTTHGQRYPFAVQGLEVGGVGVSKVQAVGQVYHLRKVADFAGTYVAVGADAALGGGAGILTMRNQHGVVINLQSTQQGLKLTAGVEGITITWKGGRT